MINFGIPPQSFLLMLEHNIKELKKGEVPDLMGKISIKDGVQMQNLFIFDKIEEMNVSHEHSHSDEHSHEEKDPADIMKDQAEKKQRIQQMIELRMKQKMVDYNQRQEEEGNKPSWIRKKCDIMSIWYYEVRT